jgi:hypothetical protein
VHAFPSLHDVPFGAPKQVKPSWNVILAPAPPKSKSRAMKAPVAFVPEPARRVPLGTRTSAVMTAPVPTEAAGGVAPNAPVVPLIPETSMRTSRAVAVTPAAAPMKMPVDALNRFEIRKTTEPNTSSREPVLMVRLAMS